jgi:hypothetical protein
MHGHGACRPVIILQVRNDAFGDFLQRDDQRRSVVPVAFVPFKETQSCISKQGRLPSHLFSQCFVCFPLFYIIVTFPKTSIETLSAEKLNQHAANRPHVGLAVAVLLPQHFLRRKVRARASFRGRHRNSSGGLV